MKNYITNNFKWGALVSVFICLSCESYLDESPDDRLELNSLDKASKVVANSYSKASYAFTDMYTDLAGPVGIADQNGVVANTGGNFIRIQDQQIYTWDDVDYIFQDSPTYFWNESYKGIAHANEVLAVIDKLPGDVEFKKAIKGEALLSRAYNHFMLVNMFGLHYDENATINLGVPYITTPETEFLPSYTRLSVAEVYDLVEKDLLEGLSLINDRFFSGTKKYHFTSKAGLAFASRFYLWKRDYEKCIEYSSLFIDNQPQIYVRNYDDLRGSNFQESGDKYSAPTLQSNLLLVTKFSSHQRANIGYRLTGPQVVNDVYRNLFNISDERISTGVFTAGTDAAYLPRLREYFFRENLSADTGTPYHISIEIKGEEVLLNRAEAYLLTGDQTAAIADINVLAKARYQDNTFDDISQVMNYYSATDESNGLLLLILDERKKEFYDHGLRWFDIKRHNRSVTHVVPVSQGGQVYELSANDLRKAVQIPVDAQSFGMTPNPR